MRDASGFSALEVITLQDMVHALTMRCGVTTATSQSNARIIKAIQHAIRGFHSKHRWRYYRRMTQFKTSAATSMEIEYDHTGGAEERLVTITDGDNWPSDAIHGELVVGENVYRILKRISNTQATLESDSSPTADFESTEATWSRRAYRFTRNIHSIEHAKYAGTNKQLFQLPMGEFSDLLSTCGRYFSWQNHGNEFGASELILHPAPTVEEVVEVSAAVLPHVPTIHSVTGTDLSGTSGTTTVTSASAAFTSKLIGSLIRISSTSTAPTQFTSDDYTFQAFITAVPTATTLTVSETIPANYSAKGYLISSPIDIEASVMLEALEDEAFYQYTKNHNHQGLKDAAAIAQKSLRDAMVRDSTMHAGYQPTTFPVVMDE